MKKLFNATLTALIVSLFSFQAVAHPSQGNKHKPGHKHGHKHGHNKVVVIKKHRPSPKKRPKHKHYHHKKMPRNTTYITIGNFTYAKVNDHYYKRQGDRYINVIIK
ncbi:hypothetical protein RCJ22_26195 [Vibrio sp. FNV 38]|nr:hypothetical protein [Vibrio sp. FNV 38]